MTDPVAPVEASAPAPEPGISEALDILDFLTNSINDLADAKSPDGKISLMSWAKVALKEAPAGIKAMRSIGELPVEIKNLNADETKQLADSSLQLAGAVMHLMGMGGQS